MRTILQRVTSASVSVDGEVVSSIGRGLLILAAVSRDDTQDDVESMVKKILKAKLWDDESLGAKGRWKHSIKDIDGEILCVSQFTLHAHFQKGSKPDFHQSAGGEKARTFYDQFYRRVGELYNPQKLKNGVFGAMMAVSLTNDGPVTIQFDTTPPKLETASTEGIKASGPGTDQAEAEVGKTNDTS